MSRKQSSRRIVLTGVSRGLGRALVDGFIAAGHTIFGCARSVEAIDQLRAHYGANHQFDAVDVGSPQQVGVWARRLLERVGPPDLLINNAGLMNRLAPLWEVPHDEFCQVLGVNVNGIFNVVRYFLPAMIQRSRGVVVNLSSGWGRSTSPQVAPYCASKWAVEGLTLALADELPHGMAAIPLNPGIIHTDMLEICFGANARAYPGAAAWAERAVPFLLGLGPKDNGRPMTVPGA